MALIEAEVIKGVYFEPSNVLFKDHIADWFNMKKNSVGIQTAQTYESLIRIRIVPTLGQVPLSSLTPMHLQNYVNELHEEGLASSSVKKIYNIIKGSLDHAINMELLTSNPIQKIQLPKDKKKEMSVWEVRDIKRFLPVAQKNRYYIAFHLAITTGMRRGEILGVRWKDIDFDRGVLYVRQTLSKDGKQFLAGAKNESSVRSIKLSNETISALLAHKVNVAKEKLKRGPNYTDYDLVVCTQNGTPVNPNNLRDTFLNLIEKADVTKIRFHDLRHTHATMLLSQGIPAKVISERLPVIGSGFSSVTKNQLEPSFFTYPIEDILL